MTSVYHDTHLSYDPGRKQVWKAIAEDIQTYIDTNDAVLDLGCGYGDFINQIESVNKIAVDSEDMSKHLSPEVEFYRGDVQTLDFIDDGSIGTVFCSNLLEHLDREEIHQTVLEIIRVLKTDGSLICIQPNFRLAYKRYFDDYTHRTIFTDISLRGLLDSLGLTVEVVRPRYLPFSMQGILPKSYLLTKAYLRLRPGLLAGQMLVVARKM